MLKYLLLAASVATALPARAADRPNIVFVLVDDIRWDAFGCMGHPWVKTPNVDRLAKEGARVKNFFVAIPLPSPPPPRAGQVSSPAAAPTPTASRTTATTTP